MQTASSEIIETIEGSTRILIPSRALEEKTPPKEPAFFNPKAKLNRDFSMISYSAFLKNYDKPKVFLEGLAGLGARGLRVAKEIKEIEKVIANDLNPKALDLLTKSIKINKLKNFEISENEVCRFLSHYSRKGLRGAIVDIDPFGSPSKFFDCGIRATVHGGLLSTTATDLQVLHGLFQGACQRRYGGKAIKTEYGNEIAIRLILGCLCRVAGRFDVEINPLFVESDMHYYRTYVQIFNRPDQEKKIGFIFHCNSCDNRGITESRFDTCDVCKSNLNIAGPLWIGKLFDKNFVKLMKHEISHFIVENKCEKILSKCALEAEMPGTYFTLDSIASKMKSSPLKLESAISKLEKSGHLASPTSLDPTGFRTDARIDEILKNFAN